MNSKYTEIFKSIVTIFLVAMLFSCTNNSKKVSDFLAAKNLPIGEVRNINHVYKDSGRITSKLIAPFLKDYSNRTSHPYNEFPEGIKIISFENNGKDSVTIIGDYALTYAKTQISELRENVVVINHTEKSRLETDQLFWDQNTDYFYSEKRFKLTTLTDTVNGVGFESKKDLSKHLAKQVTGNFLATDN